MVKVNPSLPPRGGNARLLLGKPTLGGFINSEQQGSRAGPGGCFAVRALRSPDPTPLARAHSRSAESHLLRAKHSRSAERSVPSLSWRKFPPDLLYGADMATNRLQHIVTKIWYTVADMRLKDDPKAYAIMGCAMRVHDTSIM